MNTTRISDEAVRQAVRRLSDPRQQRRDAAAMRRAFARLGQYRRALRSGPLTGQEQEALARVLEQMEDFMRESYARAMGMGAR